MGLKMNNPPIIKPKKYNQGGVVDPLKKTLFNRFTDPTGLNQMSTGVIDSVLQPDQIQNDLDSLTNELKKVQSKNKKKKNLKNENESKDYEDIDDFKKWIKNNTETDDSGEVFFVKPGTKEKVALQGEPETNVLLYEVFKEQTGREGEALEAIKNSDLQQLQIAPDQRNLGRAGDEVFAKDINKIRSEGDYKPYDSFKKIEEPSFLDRLGTATLGAGTAIGATALGQGPISKIKYVGKPLAKIAKHPLALTAAGLYGAYQGYNYPQAKKVEDERQTKLERGNALAQQAQGLLANDLQNSFLAQSGRIAGSEGLQAANQLREEAAMEMERQFFAYKRPGEDSYKLTSTPLNQNELLQLTEQGYEFAPPELAVGESSDPLEKAILAGRLPQDVTNAFFEEKYGITIPEETLTVEEELDNELKRIEIQEKRAAMAGGGPSKTEFKRFVDGKLPGLYSRGTKDALKYKLEVHVDPNGDVEYRPSPDVDGVMQDIYNAVQYTKDSKEEIDLAKQLINPSGFGVIPDTQNIINKMIANIGGIEITASDPEKLRRWAKNFTAKNITVILGESNRTISDADRKRAEEIVALDSGRWEDMGSAKNALDELVKIFEKPGRNAETAYQALSNAAETYGFADKLFDVERRLYDKRIASGKNLDAVPQSSKIFLDLASQKGESAVEANNEIEVDFDLDLTQ